MRRSLLRVRPRAVRQSAMCGLCAAAQRRDAQSHTAPIRTSAAGEQLEQGLQEARLLHQLQANAVRVWAPGDAAGSTRVSRACAD